MTVAAIMQPTYLPWAGYLAMIEKVDIFVFLDSVQFARRSWQQRNRIKSANGELMLTVPVHRKGLRDQKIQNVRIEREAGFANKHIAAIDMNYRGSAAFDAASPELYTILSNGHEKLCDLSLDVIGWLMVKLGCNTPTVRSSQLAATGKKDALLLSICREIGADTYLSAPASREYLDASQCFPGSGVEIEYHQYDHPVYPQLHGAFISSLSAIEMLFNCGSSFRQTLLSGLPR